MTRLAPEPTPHTLLPRWRHPIGGKRIAGVVDTERKQTLAPGAPTPASRTRPLRTWDVSDPDPAETAHSYYLPESAHALTPPARSASARNPAAREGGCGPSSLRSTWFAGGLRIIDINDPANPKELGYCIPKPGDGVAAPLTNDVFKDARGLLWVTDKERGLRRHRIQKLSARSRTAALPFLKTSSSNFCAN